MKIRFKNKNVSIDVKKVSLLGKFTGLMFRSKNTRNLLFEFGSQEPAAIHSFFVFFPFLAIWLDKDNNVAEWDVVKPFIPLVKPKNQPARLVEVPINKKNKKIIALFVDKKETFKYIDE